MKTIKARGITDGEAEGPVLVTPAISFLGDLDIATGNIVGDLPGVRGLSVKGRMLVMPYSRGSAGAWRFLYQLSKFHTHPVGIITDDPPDPSLVQGAILADVPVACSPELRTSEFAVTDKHIRLTVKDGRAEITLLD